MLISKRLIFGLILLASVFLSVNAQNNTFVREYSMTGHEWFDITPTGYLIAGQSSGNISLTKTDWAGNIVWSKSYGPFNSSASLGPVRRLPGWKYVFIVSDGGSIFYLVEADSAGNVLFSKKFTAQTNNLSMASVDRAANGDLLLSTIVPKQSGKYAVVTRCDSSGNMLWCRSLKSTNNGSWSFSAVPNPIYFKESANGDLLLISYISVVANPPTVFISRMNSNASAIKWHGWYGGVNCQMPSRHGILVQGDDLIISNDADTNTSFNFHPQLYRVDSSGNIIQSRRFQVYNEFWNSIYPTADGGYICAGMSRRFNMNYTLGVIIKLDSAFNIQWARRQGVPGNNQFGCGNVIARQAPDGSWISLGWPSRLFKSDINGSSGCLDSVITYTASGPSNAFFPPNELGWDTVSIVASNAGINSAPATALAFAPQCFTGIHEEIQGPEFDIYPNPASSVIELQQGNFNGYLAILNSMGESVLVQKILGNQTIDIRDLPPGLYFLQFTSGSTRLVKKLIKQ